MQSLSDQLGAAPVGVNKDADAAAAGQQALQGDAAPSDNALQSSSSQVQTDLLQEELVVPAQNEDVGGQQEEAAEPVPNAPFVADLGIPAQAQGPTPRHSTCRGQSNRLKKSWPYRVRPRLNQFYTRFKLIALAAVFAADTSGSSGPSDAGNGVSAAAAVAKRETKKRRASITYITKRRREKLRQAKRGWSGVVQVYHVQDGCRGDKKGKGGRPSHSCRRCEKERKKCSLKDAGEGSYKPCDQ